MQLEQAKVKVREYYDHGNWTKIFELIVTFGIEIVRAIREYRKEKKEAKKASKSSENTSE